MLKPARGVEQDAGDAAIRGMHILLAEDRRGLLLAMRQFLELAGATVESAYDGRQATEIAAAVTFDVLLMDLRMPHMDGFAAARVLRARGYAHPIIALAADRRRYTTRKRSKPAATRVSRSRSSLPN